MNVERNKVLGAMAFIASLSLLQSMSAVLEMDRQQILAGELWRIWTAHLVHTHITHMMLNMLAGLAIYFAFFNKLKSSELLVYGFFFSTLISLVLLGLYPNLMWYNGLSGLLHALVVYFSIRKIIEGEQVYWAGVVLVWLKVLIETMRANLGVLYQIGDMLVISEAHLIGACVGTITGIASIALYRMNTVSKVAGIS